MVNKLFTFSLVDGIDSYFRLSSITVRCICLTTSAIEYVTEIFSFSWTNDSDWHISSINKSIINKSKDYNFTDQISTEHTGAKKSIGLTRIQDFSAAVNVDSGLVETKGPLIDNIKKMKFFSGDLHSFDMMLFWGTLRQNIQDRINAFI